MSTINPKDNPPPLFNADKLKQAADSRAGDQPAPAEPKRGHPLVFCASCKARIFWATIRKKDGKLSEKPQPFDAAVRPIEEGKKRAGYRLDSEGLMHHESDCRDPETRIFITHFATCPNANQHRRT